ncbi:class I SAM-dependent methyltransferase [Paenibacillus protaetiae]|uniref:Class I SAM-dependent methyltransferase n=1 Tax=Paenibacillus protaetiae TaxID=2509456 RepID=A0A4P6FB77_9BACL|nr:class I SAM-dependent methyltransferase [Paenibacillus protaetiae]QAY67768.1 class I SAM-dependent methyltransferase [Paenibacillus protaetiae]
MYVTEHQEKWELLHAQNQFRLNYPSEPVIRFVKANFKQPAKQKLLDLGCGTGRHVVFLANEGYQTTGIDFSAEGIAYTAERLQAFGLHADLVTGSILSLPFESDSFDGIISVSVLYYFTTEDIRRAVQEIHRVLKPGGKAFFVIRRTDDKRYGKGVEIETNTFRMDSDFSNELGMTIHFFSEQELAVLFSGFSDLSIGFLKEGFASLTECDADFLVTVTK